jgi:hypothetical protein
MQKTLHKRIMIISLLVIVLMTITGMLLFLFSNLDKGDIVAIYILAVVFSLLSIFTSYALIKEEMIWIRKTAKYTYKLFPLLLIGLMIVIILTGNGFVMIITASIFILLSVFFLLHIFIFSDATSIKASAIFVALILVAIVLKRYHIMFAGAILSIVLLLFSLGSYIYGIRCLYLAEKNSFLKYVSFLFSCVLPFSWLGLLIKLQHWPGGDIILRTGEISLVLITIFVLLVLPSTGFIDWLPLHKKILKRLLLPWVLVFFLFLVRYLSPEANKLLWNSDRNVTLYGFEMKDYEPEIRNGL